MNDDDKIMNFLIPDETNSSKKANPSLKPVYVDVLKILGFTVVLVVLMVLIIGLLYSSQYRIILVSGIILGVIATILISRELSFILELKGKYQIKIKEN